jgi:hypothetical protein
VVGKKAKILLHGRLTMNNSPMSLQLLKNIKVTINAVNNQDISTFYEYDIKQWSDSQDLTIDFPVKSYIKQVYVSVTGKITLQSKKEISVNSTKQITIDLGEDKDCFV